MLNYNPLACLPSSKELPDSDDTPVDNQLQKSIPDLLRSILAMAWEDSMDWFFGIRMGIYYDPDLAAIVPDGFLSLGTSATSTATRRTIRRKIAIAWHRS